MQAFSLFVVSLHFIRTYHFKIIPNQTKKLFFHSFFYELLLTKCPWCDIGIYCIPETSERELLILIVFYSIFWIENVMWYCFSIKYTQFLMDCSLDVYLRRLHKVQTTDHSLWSHINSCKMLSDAWTDCFSNWVAGLFLGFFVLFFFSTSILWNGFY